MIRDDLATSYDYIVCGGGTSGCVVAARLSEQAGVSVLLLEAGGDERVPAVEDSTVWMANIGSERDWRFHAEPSPHLNGRTPPLPMGRVLGGGSSVNGLVWARGHKTDFDLWEATTGDPGWGYDAALAIFRRIEDWDGPPDARRRGSGGPVYVTRPRDPVPLVAALLDATASLGIPRVDDLNAETMETDGGCGVPNVTVAEGGRRVSMASAYLRPAMARPNLTVVLGAEVGRVTLDGMRATAVTFSVGGTWHSVAARREIVLSAGAINTPKILMLSGIGDAVALRRLGIDVACGLRGVGENFQDHILVAGCVWEYVTPEPPRNNSAEFTLFWKSRSDLPAPDLQPILEECGFGSEVTGPRYRVPADRAHAWTLAPGLIRPQSRGRVRLTGAGPHDPVAIDANFLSAPEDMQALLRATELCREIGNAPALRPFVRREIMPGPLSRPELERFLRDAAGTYFHQTCTAKMGHDDMSVVDGTLRVHGVAGLRVADGSVMPAITGGNTMAPCVLIGERAAELILAAA